MAETTRARDLGIRIGVLPAGPTASIADVPGVGVGHVTVWRDEPRTAGRPRRGQDRRHRHRPWRQPVPRPRAGRRRGAERGRRVHRVPRRRRVGPGRDAGVPDLDDAGRPGVRRRLRAADDRGSRHRHRRRDHPASWPSATTASCPTPAGCRSARPTCGTRGRRPGRRAMRGSASRAGRGRGRRGHRHELPWLQGRHRHGLAAGAVRAHRRRAGPDQLR